MPLTTRVFDINRSNVQLGIFRAKKANKFLLDVNQKFHNFCSKQSWISKDQELYSNSQSEGCSQALIHACIVYQDNKNLNEIYFSTKTSKFYDIPFVIENYKGINQTQYLKVKKIDNKFNESYISSYLCKVKLSPYETFENNNYIRFLNQNEIKYFFYEDEDFINLHKDETINLYNIKNELASLNCIYSNIHNVVLFNRKNGDLLYEDLMKFDKELQIHKKNIDNELAKYGIKSNITKIEINEL